jgi:hypothetical protein
MIDLFDDPGFSVAACMTCGLRRVLDGFGGLLACLCRRGRGFARRLVSFL